ncbi:50S ribosomal protein L1 [Arenicella sp. 4NH20-0111]|uniref:50S ribosomal protein L1 n=1 Tax=Arenicella sp. 4NH20-0111 TaxID=3127648 RepID=UPI00310B72E5
MAKMNKRMQAVTEKVDADKFYSLDEVFALAKDTASAKFDESVDVAINLGIDARKSDQAVRGATVLPKGTGKTVRVAVFTDGDNVAKAEEAGADVVGMDDLAAKVKAGEMDFDIVIASPDAMRVVGQLGQILGPRGLMPNPKTGTVSADVATAVRNAKAGQVQYRIDKAGIIHSTIGKASFSAEDLHENFMALLAALHKAKPASAKGQYFKRVSVSTTMGTGIRVDRQTLPQF